MLLDLLKAPCLCMVCYGNVSSMRHIYGKSFDNTRQHIFLKTDARNSWSQWSLNCICTDSVTPRFVHKPNLGFLGFGGIKPVCHDCHKTVPEFIVILCDQM